MILELRSNGGFFEYSNEMGLWLKLGRWTFYYKYDGHSRSFWYRDAWRSQDNEMETGWTVRAFRRELLISRQAQV